MPLFYPKNLIFQLEFGPQKAYNFLYAGMARRQTPLARLTGRNWFANFAAVLESVDRLDLKSSGGKIHRESSSLSRGTNFLIFSGISSVA